LFFFRTLAGSGCATTEEQGCKSAGD